MRVNKLKMERRDLTIVTLFNSLIITLLLSCHSVYGQKIPDRGFQPARSYSMTDIETINTTNGNLLFNIPLASLPAGRGGLSAHLNLIYNSKIWDPSPAFIPDPNNWSQTVSRTWLLPALRGDQTYGSGGWHYGFKYKIELVNRLDQYMYSATKPQCPNNQAYEIYKLRITLPDGSTHELTPQSFESNTTYPDNYYSIRPDGYRAYCNCRPDPGPPVCDAAHNAATTNRMLYYSTDGTYLRLDIEHDSDDNWSNNSWTLYLSDGTRVVSSGIAGTGGNSSGMELQTIYDRNDNRIEIQRTAYNNNPADVIADQLNRSIIIEHGCAQNQDCIYAKGFNNQTLMWTVKWKEIAVHKTFYAGTYNNGSFGLDTTLRVIDQITLPAQAGGLAYTFNYNADTSNPSNGWGEVNGVTLPSGASVAYTYKYDGYNGLNWSDVLKNYPKRKDLTYQLEYDGATAQTTDTWEYEINSESSIVKGPDGGIVTEAFYSLEMTGPSAGLVYRTERADGTIIERNWSYNTPPGASGGNPYVKTEFTSVRDANGYAVNMAIKDYSYDKNGNVTRVAEYDWIPYSSAHASGSPAIPSGLVPARVTTSSYYHQTPDASTTGAAAYIYIYHGNERLHSLPEKTEISSGTGQVFSRTEFSYDDIDLRGNLIEQRSWDSSKGALITGESLTADNAVIIKHEYDNNTTDSSLRFGNLTRAIDPNGNKTEYTYGSVAGPNGTITNLYPTQTIIAAGKPEQRTTTQQYDFYSGLVTQMTDADNNVSTSTEYDALGRPTLVKVAEGKMDANNNLIETQTKTEYADALRRVITRADLNVTGDGKLVSIQHYDQLGRVRLTRQLEDACVGCDTDETKGIKIQTRYFTDKVNGNSYRLVSNPYRAATSGEANTPGASDPQPNMGWTRTRSDMGGRIVEVQTFSGSSLPAPWGNPANTDSTGAVLTSYDGPFTTVTDQAQKARKSELDAFGRIVKVFEDPANLNYQTSYSYDILGNLTTVAQNDSKGNQTRSFTYSSLSRLTAVQNPESGTIDYQYDASGNLVLKLDRRTRSGSGTLSNCSIPYTGSRTATCYKYDSLNRLTSRSYNDGTPNVTYSYDTLLNGKGRLTSISSSVSTTAITQYDALGRVRASQQETQGGAAPYTFEYNYNLAGGLTSQKYPSGKVFITEYDFAGRMSGVKRDGGNYYVGASSTPPQQGAEDNRIRYTAHGAVSAMRLGNGLWEHTEFNSRLQPINIKLGTSASGTDAASENRLKLTYSYGTTDNNGNLLSQTISVPTIGTNAGFTATQNYTYDRLNRIETFSETNGLTQTFEYDRWGNRVITAGYVQDEVLTPKSLATFGANNQLVNSQYDEAGNVKQDAAGRTFTYDAENHQTGFNNGAATYQYDGDGGRVKKVVGSETTIFVYNILGQMVAEYTNSTEQQGSGTSYLTADNLGTPRVITGSNIGDEKGGVKARHDYLPFGEEITSEVAGRATGNGYVIDNVREKFTGKERDSETELDYFGARYYSSSQGRFTSADPGPFTPADPQSWNRYSYVQNNPLKFIDPTGTTLILTGDYADYIVRELERYTGYKLKRDQKTGVVTIDEDTERKKKGTSKALAEKLNEVIGDKDADVRIETVKNTDVDFDDFDTRKLDVADYNVAKRDAPEFAAASLGHVLEEYYQAEKQYWGYKQESKFNYAHEDGKKFESKVLSDFTGRYEAAAKEYPGKTDNRYHFIYSSVAYDITYKSKADNEWLRVTRIKNRAGRRQ